jgi:hypothetical protein
MPVTAIADDSPDVDGDVLITPIKLRDEFLECRGASRRSYEQAPGQHEPQDFGNVCRHSQPRWGKGGKFLPSIESGLGWPDAGLHSCIDEQAKPGIWVGNDVLSKLV